MKVGDLVQVRPARVGYYIIIDEDPEKENNWPGEDGVPLGRLWELYSIEAKEVRFMYERWIDVVNEGR